MIDRITVAYTGYLVTASSGRSSGASGGGSGGSTPELGSGIGTVIEVRILSGERAGEQLHFFDPQKVVLGRNPASDVILPDPGVSRQHAELTVSKAEAAVSRPPTPLPAGSKETASPIAVPQLVLRDVGSTAGTFFVKSGERITSSVLVDCAGTGEGTAANHKSSAGVEISLGPVGQGPRCKLSAGLSIPFGRYLLTGRIGGGGMAEVFLARQRGLGGLFRPVALKLIQPEMFNLIDASAMFLDEARIAAEISHHNVVKIYDVGEQDGVLYLAMEYLRGVTLASLSAQLQQRAERLPPDLVAALVSQACAGLHAAHQLRDMSGRLLNVVHRDVSPSNLMLLPEGLIKVIDFGVARADTRLVAKDEGLQGKPAYMSPEQVQAQTLDCRSDVFALGVVLYELCSGQPLFWREDTVATFYAVVRGEVPPLREVCPGATPLLEQIVAKALAKKPEHRYQSAADLLTDLDRVVVEAGRRFSNLAAVGRFLTDLGVTLTASPPTLLTAVPKTLQTLRLQVKTPSVPSLAALAGGSGALDDDDGLLELGSEPAAPVAPAISSGPPPPPAATAPQPVSSRPPLRPLTSEPGRLVGMVVAERYRLTRYLGGPPPEGELLSKLYYQATVLPAGPVKPPLSQSPPSSGTPSQSRESVVLLICGLGPELAPLPAPAREQLQQQASKRRPPHTPRHLLPILQLGELPTADPLLAPGASYLVVPYVADSLSQHLSQSSSQLQPIEVRVQLVQQLVAALATLQSSEPGFVCGDLKPSSLGLTTPRRPPPIPGSKPSAQSPVRPEVVLLDALPDGLLGTKPSLGLLPLSGPASGPPRSGRRQMSLYLAPERLTGAPPSAAGDVFAIAAMAYQLLGGDLQQATQCLRNRREVPTLPPQPSLLPHLELAILSALRLDPLARPDAATLLSHLQLPPVPAASAGQAIPLPAAGHQVELRTRAGVSVVLQSLTVAATQQHSTQPLPLPPGLLPAPLLLSAHGDTLTLEIEGPAPGYGRDRIGLYHEASDPSTRCDRLALQPQATAAHFQVGHRRLQVQRVDYASAVSAATAAPLQVQLPTLDLCIGSAGPLRRLLVLSIQRAKEQPAFVLCIAVG